MNQLVYFIDFDTLVCPTLISAFLLYLSEVNNLFFWFPFLLEYVVYDTSQVIDCVLLFTVGNRIHVSDIVTATQSIFLLNQHEIYLHFLF